MSADDPQPADPAELRDELPDDLNAAELVGPYQFPDNSRRRIPGVIYLVIAVGSLALWVKDQSDPTPLVNDGMLVAAVLLAAVGIYSITSGWRMHVDEQQALAASAAAVGFPVGHASAQQVWRGLRSRPTWRVLCYSVEEPPRMRGLVVVDAVDGRVVEQLVEENPETVPAPSPPTP